MNDFIPGIMPCSMTFVGWDSSPEGWIKVNSDGSVVALSKAACGGVLRNTFGDFLGGFSVNLGVCPITIAEVWGAFYGLQRACTRGFRRVVFEMDSTSAITLIKGYGQLSHPYAVSQRVRELLKK